MKASMSRHRLLWLALGLSLIVSGEFARAHHSSTAQFDPNQSVMVTGTISAVEWRNPHVWFYVDVTSEDGTITTWGFETAPPGALMRRGVTREQLVIGAVVQVEGTRARDGSNNANSRSLTFPDGTNVLTPQN
jgi:hypothetical protein